MTKNSQKESLIAHINSQEHMANERTFLAWIRTSIGLIAFGFVLERFYFFLTQLTHLFAEEMGQAPRMSGFHKSLSVIGISMIVMGLLITTMAYFRFKKTTQQLIQSKYAPTKLLECLLTVLIVAAGLFLLIYLIFY